MNIDTFLSLVWGQGSSFIVTINQSHKMIHIPCPDIRYAKAAITRLEAAGRTVYFACALFSGQPNAEGKLRTAAQALGAKSFWLDIDCGEGKPHLDRDAAWDALDDFVDDLNLPDPMVIGSGSGLHVYWPLESAVEPIKWLPVAHALKTACASRGFSVDPARTTDIASILRPPGTTNHKRGAPVEVLHAGEVTTYAAMRKALSVYVQDTSVELTARPAHVTISADDALSANMEQDFPTPDVETLLPDCAALREFQASRGDLFEPAWYHGMGVLLHCKDGERLCHDWSDGYAGYTQAETDKKIAQLQSVGPTTCKVMEKYFAGCAKCVLRGTITTPLQIGTSVAPSATKLPPDPVDHANPTSAQPAAGLPTLPPKYRIAQVNGQYRTEYIVGNGEPPMLVLPGMMYVDNFYIEDAKMYMSIQLKGTGRNKNVDLPTSALSNNREWMGRLLGAGMNVSDKNSKQVKQFLHAWLSLEGTKDVDTMFSYTHLGWTKDGFVLGERLYRGTGEVSPIRLSAAALTESKGMEPIGSVKRWSEIIKALFGQPGMEHFQFTLLCSLASPLLNFLNDKGGLLVYAHSDNGGHGKTTAEHAALSVWGSWKERSRSINSTTDIALQTFLGAMSHLPIIYDELTNYDSKRLSQFIHMINEGQPRSRSTKAGSIATKSGTWDLIVCASGNSLLSDKLSTVKSNSSAEMSRIFEYAFPPIKSNLTTSEASSLMEELEGHTGCVGDVYVRYLVKNRAAIEADLRELRNKLGAKYKFEAIDRYRARLMTAVIYANVLSTRLGFTSFSTKKILNWMAAAITGQQQVTIRNSLNPEAKFNDLLADFTPDLLVTMGDATLYTRQAMAMAEIVTQPRGKIKGWVQLPHPADPRPPPPKEFLFATAIRKWCADRSESYEGVVKAWVAAGLIAPNMLKNTRYGEGVAQFSAHREDMHEVLLSSQTIVAAHPLPQRAMPVI